MRIRIINADALTALPQLAVEGFRAHSVVTDPPYHLTSIVKRFGSKNAAPVKPGAYGRAAAGFMGQKWDGGDVAFRPETWRAVFDCMLPGAHLVAFGGTRTWHRMVVAIEDAGFEIRDTLCWLYGSGFPKSHDVSKGIDRAAGAEREVIGSKLALPGYHLNGHDGGAAFGAGLSSSTPESRLASSQITAPATSEAAAWSGWGTALKPAFEPIILARKPLDGTVAANTIKHGCGGLNIEASRVPTEAPRPARDRHKDASLDETRNTYGAGLNGSRAVEDTALGRWPANVLHSGDAQVEEAFARFGERPTGGGGVTKRNTSSPVYSGPASNTDRDTIGYADTGSASRYFKSCPYEEHELSGLRFHFCAKADASDRAGSRHPTVKPTALMRWLVQLVTPPGGTVLDPFAGTGSTGLAADQLGMNAVLIERDPKYAADAERKIKQDAPLFADVRQPTPDLDAAYQRQPGLFEVTE